MRFCGFTAYADVILFIHQLILTVPPRCEEGKSTAGKQTLCIGSNPLQLHLGSFLPESLSGFRFV